MRQFTSFVRKVQPTLPTRCINQHFSSLLPSVLCIQFYPPFLVSEALLYLFLPASSFRRSGSSGAKVILLLAPLKLVQFGIQRGHLERCQGNTRIRLLITPEILLRFEPIRLLPLNGSCYGQQLQWFSLDSSKKQLTRHSTSLGETSP